MELAGRQDGIVTRRDALGLGTYHQVTTRPAEVAEDLRRALGLPQG